MSQAKKISDDANAEILMMMAMLSSKSETTIENVTGTMDSFKVEMKGDVENLESKMVTGFNNAGFDRKKIL